jgi:curved DNA-binding protein CbpA
MPILSDHLIGSEYFKSIGVSDTTEFSLIKKTLTSKNPFQILGLDNTASMMQIKSAYRKLALQFHPDRYCSQQTNKYSGYDSNEIKQLAESVMHAINTAYTTLSNKTNQSTANVASTGYTDFRVVFPPHPPKIDKKSVSDFIAKMQSEISKVISKGSDNNEKYQQVIMIMQRLQTKINENRDLLLPDLQPSFSSFNSMALQSSIGRNYLLSKNYQVFVLECLNDVKEAEDTLVGQDPDLLPDSESSCWQVAIKCLKFLLHKMYKLLTFDNTPIYTNGWYNGLFLSPKINVNDTINKVKRNLTREKELTELDERMPDSACMTGAAIWLN